MKYSNIYFQLLADDSEQDPGAQSGRECSAGLGGQQSHRDSAGLETPSETLGHHLDHVQHGVLHHGEHHQVGHGALLHRV